MSVSRADPQKVASCAHNPLPTSAKASEKVGWGLSYHAARRTALDIRPFCWSTKSATNEKTPNSAGATLRIARSDQCLCVSKPKC
jgi:hypothetical protein